MKQQPNSNLYLADSGMTFIRKSDNFVMGTGIDLGDLDTIDNYDEVPLTEENDIEGILKRDAERKARTEERKARHQRITK